MGWRQPGVEGHGRGLDREPEHDCAEDQRPAQGLTGQRRLIDELHHVEGMRIGRDVESDEPSQQRKGAEEGVDEELHRRSPRVAVSPPGDHEVHSHDGQVEEHEEEDEVSSHEQAETDALQKEKERRLDARSVLVLQGEHGAGQEDDRSHSQQRQRQTVHAEVITAVHARNPRRLLREGQLARLWRLVSSPERDDQEQVDRRDGDPGPPSRPRRHARRRGEHDRRE